jgi:hypothetical protein
LKKVAIFNWGEVTIHPVYLAEQLKLNGLDVSFFVYTPTYVSPSYLSLNLDRIKRQFPVEEFGCTGFETNLIRLNRALALLNKQSARLLNNMRLPARTRKLFKPEDFDVIITVNQNSLYWLSVTSVAALSKTIHYSLEINRVSDPDVDPSLSALVREEQKLLNKIYGLIIQDQPRASALLQNNPASSKLKIFYLPVSLPGPSRREKSGYLHKKLGVEAQKQFILYLGSPYKERHLEELISRFERDSRGYVLVLHGPQPFTGLSSNSREVKFSNDVLEVDNIILLTTSAAIGIAIYDNGWPNTRLTAFSSDKVARYAQAGLPFLAMDNESFRMLRDEFRCCELINSFDELIPAIERIMADYNRYSEAAYMAYEKYYRIDRVIAPLIDHLKHCKLAHD